MVRLFVLSQTYFPFIVNLLSYFREMNVEFHKSLLAYNTFHIDVIAQYFAVIHHQEELLELLDSKISKENKLFIVGGGSNILLTDDIKGLVIHNEMKGIEIISEDEQSAIIKFKSGEIWHDCVNWCLQNNFGGIENLSLIPGTIGAAPIQNIGAYGVELKDTFISLEATHLQTKTKRILSKDECEFDYRQSIFKQKEKGNYLITSVTLQLSKVHQYNTSYGNIQQELDRMEVQQLNIKSISEAVINIRKSKLPDPALIGNAGSFFKNPVISLEQLNSLRSTHYEIPNFKHKVGVKIPAAWLIEHSHPPNAKSWKGYRENNYGVHDLQALCLVNYANAKGGDIFNLSERIIQSVEQTFQIILEREVNIW